MFEQEGIASLKDIVEGVIVKNDSERYPHVFGDVSVKNAEDVIDNWPKIKASEENIKQRESLLDGHILCRSPRALSRAQKLCETSRPCRIRFWTNPEGNTSEDRRGTGGIQRGDHLKIPRKHSRGVWSPVVCDSANAARHLNVKT